LFAPQVAMVTLFVITFYRAVVGAHEHFQYLVKRKCAGRTYLDCIAAEALHAPFPGTFWMIVTSRDS
jgi:hypothetical protein